MSRYFSKVRHEDARDTRPMRFFRRAAAAAVTLAALTVAGCTAGPPSVPERLDAADQRLMEETAQRALESNRVGESANWASGTTGHVGTVTPIETFERNAVPCREFQMTATVGGKTAIGYDTACRRADGVWVSRNFDSLVAALQYADRHRGSYHPRDRYYDPFYDDPWCGPRGYRSGPYCRPRSGLSFGVGVGRGF